MSRNGEINTVVASIAAEAECQPAQVALAWVRDRDVIPILAARTAQQINEDLGVLEVSLSTEQTDRLNQATQIDLGYPHEYLCKTRSAAYGGMFERIDRHRDRGAGTS